MISEIYSEQVELNEPVMTKAFLHGRTEVIRTVQPQSVHFTMVSSHFHDTK